MFLIFNIIYIIFKYNKNQKGCDNMQTISGKIMKTYNKFIGQIMTRNNKKRGNENF